MRVMSGLFCAYLSLGACSVEVDAHQRSALSSLWRANVMDVFCCLFLLRQLRRLSVSYLLPS